MTRLYRSIFLSALLFGSFVVSAHAAGASIVIEQKGPFRSLGNYFLTRPDGVQVNGNNYEVTKFVTNAPLGNYTLKVEPQAGALTSIRIIQDDTEIASIAGTELSFNLETTGSVRIEISYVFFGTVSVTSIPSGVPFELKGSNYPRIVGVTPAVYTNLPPLTFRVQYGSVPGCRAPKAQERQLLINDELRFEGEYLCNLNVDTDVPEETEVIVTEGDLSVPHVRIWHSISQSEVLPGGAFRVTLGIRNLTQTTLRNLVLSDQIEADKVMTDPALPDGGVRRGDLLVWDIPEIFSGQTWTTTYVAHTREDIAAGTPIVFTGRVEGNDIHATRSTLDLTDTAEVRATMLPQTGWMMDVLAVAMLFVLGLGFTVATKKAQ